jgi:hypothetical protein
LQAFWNHIESPVDRGIERQEPILDFMTRGVIERRTVEIARLVKKEAWLLSHSQPEEAGETRKQIDRLERLNKQGRGPSNYFRKNRVRSSEYSLSW